MFLRINWTSKQRLKFFEIVRNKLHGTWPSIALQLNTHPRTLRDWRQGKTKMPKDIISRVERILNTKFTTQFTFIEEGSHRSDAGRKGALVRTLLYGNSGTPEGRKKGGLRSAEIQRSKKTNFKRRLVIKYPTRNTNLAEFVGIIMGDGGITSHQITITGCQSTDAAYKMYVANLGQMLFGLQPGYSLRDNDDCWIVRFSSINMSRYLQGLGLCIGNKINQGLDIPDWIYKKPILLIACLRGLFDTDGCVYQDHHVVSGKTYTNLGLTFSTASVPLRSSIQSSLIQLGFSPTVSTGRNIFLRRRKDIDTFFSIIQPKNEKHTKRYRAYNQPPGEVA